MNVEYGPPNSAMDPLLINIKGRYIIDGQHFLKSIRSLELHRERCLKVAVDDIIRSRTQSLFWYLDFECPFCNENWTVTNKPLITIDTKKTKIMEIKKNYKLSTKENHYIIYIIKVWITKMYKTKIV